MFGFTGSYRRVFLTLKINTTVGACLISILNCPTPGESEIRRLQRFGKLPGSALRNRSTTQ